MKRPPSPIYSQTVTKQKFPSIDFSNTPDKFSMFFSKETPKNHKGTVSCDPYPEVILSNTLDLSIPSLSKKISESSPSPLLYLLSNYVDTLLPSSTSCILTHTLNHIYKSKAIISENNTQPSPIKDQAFTPATVLILVPTLESSQEVIDFFISAHCKKKKKLTKFSAKKYSEVFHEDYDRSADAVKFGISFNDRELSLFSSFKKCDVILATPLSLRQGLEKGEGFDKGILCSVQICVILNCHELLMQNWDHLDKIFENMNLIPDRDSVSSDLNRIRDEYLDGESKKFRQIIIQSEFLSPLIMKLFNGNPNFRGKARVISHYSGVVAKTVQKFRKFLVNNVQEISQKRFEYFVKVWESMKEEIRSNSLVFISSYFEFVRVKNWFDENDPGVLCISEYTPKPERQRNLSLWKNGSNKVLCLTERLLYFRPVKFSLVGNAVFYDLPEFKERYVEVIENSEETLAIFCRFDGFSLQRIVGDGKAEKMLASNSEIFSIN